MVYRDAIFPRLCKRTRPLPAFGSVLSPAASVHFCPPRQLFPGSCPTTSHQPPPAYHQPPTASCFLNSESCPSLEHPAASLRVSHPSLCPPSLHLAFSSQIAPAPRLRMTHPAVAWRLRSSFSSHHVRWDPLREPFRHIHVTHDMPPRPDTTQHSSKWTTHV